MLPHSNELRKKLFADQNKRNAKWTPKANKHISAGEEDKSLEQAIGEFFKDARSHLATLDEISNLESKSGRAIPAALKLSLIHI